MWIYSDKINSVFNPDRQNKVWFLLGDEFVLIEDSLKKLFSHIWQKNEQNNIYYYPERTFNFNFLKEKTSGGLFNNQYCFVFRLSSINLTKQQLAGIEYFLNHNKNNIIIFTYADFMPREKSSALVKLIDKNGIVVRHMAIKLEQFNYWTKNRLLRANLSLDSEAFNLFCHYCQGNLMEVDQSIKKLILLAKNKFNLNDIKNLMQENAQCSIFDFLDSLANKDVTKSLSCLDLLLKNKQNLIKIIWFLDKEIRVLINIKNALNLTDNIDLNQFGIFPNKQKIILNYLKNKSINQLMRLSILIGKLDRCVKGLNNIYSKQLIHKIVLLMAQ